MPTPGILSVTAKITHPALLSPSTLTTWYDEVHFPDILKTSGMKTTLRYKALAAAFNDIDNKNNPPQPSFFYYYPLHDLAFLRSPEFRAIPITSDLLPGPRGLVFDFVAFDTRCYELVQVFEPKGTKAGPATLLISSAMTTSPAESSSDPDHDPDTDLDGWYRHEHLPLLTTKHPSSRTISTTTSPALHYRRTRRYKLATALQTAMQLAMMTAGTAGASEAGAEASSAKQQELKAGLVLPPTWLALHEFDLGSSGGGEGEAQVEVEDAKLLLPLLKQELARTEDTPWARRVLGGLKVREERVYRFVSGKGEVEWEF